MSKVHITLVGAQPAPIYNGIVATSPDKVIYIYSENSLATRNRLNEYIKEEDSYLLDVTSPLEIKALAEKLAEKYKNDEITVNISSGLKSWSHWFGVVFDKCDNAAVVYIDQNNVLWNYKTMKSHSDFHFDMHTLFDLYGNSIKGNYTPFTEYTSEDFIALAEIEKARQTDIKKFNALTTVLNGESQHKLRSEKKGCFEIVGAKVEWDKEVNSVKYIIDKKGSNKVFHICSPHVCDMFFNAGWFEVKIAHILQGWKYAKEVCINCRFPFRHNLDKNEVDIIINTGNKILFVECKTQINNTTDIDKFRTVIKTYGGTASKGLFITDAKMNDMPRTKCDEHGILAFSLQDNHLGMDTVKALYWLLETELFNINPK